MAGSRERFCSAGVCSHRRGGSDPDSFEKQVRCGAAWRPSDPTHSRKPMDTSTSSGAGDIVMENDTSVVTLLGTKPFKRILKARFP